MKWLDWFSANSTYRTVCNDCYDMILENYLLHRKRIRRQEKIKLRIQREKEELENMSDGEK